MNVPRCFATPATRAAVTPQLPGMALVRFVLYVERAAGEWEPFSGYATELQAARMAKRLRGFGWVVCVRRMELPHVT